MPLLPETALLIDSAGDAVIPACSAVLSECAAFLLNQTQLSQLVRHVAQFNVAGVLRGAPI